MRFLSRLLPLFFALALPTALQAQNTTTSITASNILIGGTGSGRVEMPYGTVCAVAVNLSDNPITFSATGWGLVPSGNKFCGTIASGVITGGLPVPDASHTNNAQPIGYDFILQQTTSTGVPIGNPISISNVSGVTGTTFALDSYTPAATGTVISPSLAYGSSVPSTCTSPSIYTTNGGLAYVCAAGVYVQISGSGGGGGITALTGDVVASGAGSVASTIANGAVTTAKMSTTGVTAGSYTLATVTVGADGRITTAANGSASNILGTLPIAGATSDYRFNDISGSTLPDHSGNGNNATLGSSTSAPTAVQSGLLFTNQQNVALPGAVNATKTFIAAVYINPLSFGGPNTVANLTGGSNQYPVLISSSLAGSGINLLYARNGAQLLYDYAPDIYTGNSHTTQSNTTLSGYHVLTYVLGTGSGNLDHVYIDGNEAAYTLQGSSFGGQTSGNLFLGSSQVSPFVASGFEGTFYRFVSYPNQLTQAQVQATGNAITAEVALRGVPVMPPNLNSAAVNLLASGSSLTCCQGLNANGSQNWPALLTLTNQPTYTVLNYGISGITLDAIAGSEPNRLAQYCKTAGGQSIYILQGGDNDAQQFAGVTPQQTFNLAARVAQVLKQAGCRTYMTTNISRTGTAAGYGGTFDAFKDAYDSIILTNAVAQGFDGIVDVAAIPTIGCDGCYANSTGGTPPFQIDNTHLTAAGQLLWANAVSNKLNYDFGYKLSNPHIIAATTYQLTAGDGAVTAAPSANSAYTLPDCTGQSGAIYTISNPQSAFTVSIIAGSSSQPINGLTTAITIPSNSTISIRDVANPKTIAGCHWAM